MTVYLINHLRVPREVPKPEALVYLQTSIASSEISLYVAQWIHQETTEPGLTISRIAYLPG